MTFYLLYAFIGFLSFLSTVCLIRLYYGGPVFKDAHVVFICAFIFWPVGFPLFMYHFRKEVVSVFRGRDWVDDHLSSTEAASFREYERNIGKK